MPVYRRFLEHYYRGGRHVKTPPTTHGSLQWAGCRTSGTLDNARHPLAGNPQPSGMTGFARVLGRAEGLTQARGRTRTQTGRTASDETPAILRLWTQWTQ
jgi:hypothetical protein